MNMTTYCNGITPLDEGAMMAARERQEVLLKPLGSLGALEDLSVQMAGITGQVYNSVEKKLHILFGADNGVYEEGIASSPQSFTNLLMGLYGRPMHCAINVLCKQRGVDLRLVDIGVKGELDYSRIENRRLMEGTDNFAKGLAMPRDIAEAALSIGFSYGAAAKEEGYQILGNGEVGMGNTTTAAACIMAVLGVSDPELAVGRGAGLTDEAFSTKKRIIGEALAFHKPRRQDALDILSKVGGLDIAAMTGLYLGAAYHRLPIVADGVISLAAALLACTMQPLVRHFIIPSHVSEEPAYHLAAEKLGLKPMLSLGMRLGEGTGCPLAMGLVDDALGIFNTMNTFADVTLAGDYRKELRH